VDVPKDDLGGIEEWFEWHPAPAYVGLELIEATEKARAVGVDDVRLISLDENAAGLTLELRPTRLNLALRRGVVVLAGYF
jgi:hypothetical protein